MQAPPTSEYKEAKKKMSSTTIILIILGVVVGGGCILVAVLAAIAMPMFAQARQAAKETSSLANMKQLSVGLQVYAAENDGCFPPAAQWATATASKVDAKAFHDPILDSARKRPFGYAMNAAASSVRIDAIQDLNNGVLLFTSSKRAENAIGQEGDLRKFGKNRFIIGFADGSSKKIQDDSAGGLDWQLRRVKTP